MASNRIGRINEEIQRELSDLLRELKDPRIHKTMLSITRVETTPDLRWAKVYVSVMGDDETKKKAIEGLKSAAGYVRREMGRRIDLRYTPEPVFELDHSIEHGAYINQLLKGDGNVKKD